MLLRFREGLSSGIHPIPFISDPVVGQFGLVELESTSMRDYIKFIDPSMDSVFVEAARRLVQSGHPDICHAWKDVWLSSWPNHCPVWLKGASDERIGPLVRDDSDDMGVFNGFQVPLRLLSRVYTPGQKLVLVLGVSSCRCATVVAQQDSFSLLVSTHSAGPDTSSFAAMNEQCVVRAEHTLDYDSFGFLVDAPVEDSIVLDLLPGCHHFPARMTLQGTESLIGLPAFVLEGTFKGYTGTLKLVT